MIFEGDDWFDSIPLGLPQVGGAITAGGNRNDDSYRREANDEHRKRRPFGYAPVNPVKTKGQQIKKRGNGTGGSGKPVSKQKRRSPA